MKRTAIILSILLLLGSNVMAQRVETIGRFTFIQHDSIPMHYFTGRWDTGSFLKALTPAYPIWQTFTNNQVEIERLGLTGCFSQRYACVFYKVIINGDTLAIGTREEFRKIFAPVESVQEAIAFAHVFTGSFPIFNLDFLREEARRRQEFEKQKQKNQQWQDEWQDVPLKYRPIPPLPPLFRVDDGWEILHPEIISSFAKVTEYGYKLLLYHQGFRLSPIWHGSYVRRLIKVTFDGEVEILEEIEAFFDRSNLW